MALLRPKAGAVATLLAFLTVAGLASAPPATPAEVQAAFLCSFVEFVDWPPGAVDGPVTVGVLGEDPFGALLEATAKNRPVQTKSIVVKRVATLEEARTCQLVFVGASEARILTPILQALATSSILTVSDIAGFAKRGGMIGFTIEDKRVRFEINLEAAERANLRISSRLLKLARIVANAPHSGS